MNEAFIEVTGARFVSGEAKPAGKFVIVTSEVASIERGPGATSVVILTSGERFSVIESLAALTKALKR